MASPLPHPPAAAVPSWTPRAAAALLGLTLAAAALRLAGIGSWAYAESEALGWLWLAEPLGAALPAPPQRLAPAGWLALHALVDAGLLPLRGEGWARLPAALAGTCAVPLLALAVRPYGGVGAALLAAALVAVHPAALAASQALDPAMLAAVLGLAAAAAMRTRRLAIAAALALLAAATSPGAIGLPVAMLLLALPPQSHRRVAAALGGLAFAAALAGLGASMLPLVAFAAVGWPIAPRPLRVVVGAVALGAAVAGRTEGGGFAVAVAVPALAALSALGLRELAAAVRAGFAAPARLQALAVAAPATVVFTWLLVDAFLYANVHQGGRSPWRRAADALWDAADRAPAVAVAAGAGEPSLRAYLRPGPGQGVVVLPFASDGGAEGVQELAARPEPVVLVALREDELVRLPAATRAALAAAFVCARVVPSPQLHGDDTVTVFARRPAGGATPR